MQGGVARHLDLSLPPRRCLMAGAPVHESDVGLIHSHTCAMRACLQLSASKGIGSAAFAVTGNMMGLGKRQADYGHCRGGPGWSDGGEVGLCADARRYRAEFGLTAYVGVQWKQDLQRYEDVCAPSDVQSAPSSGHGAACGISRTTGKPAPALGGWPSGGRGCADCGSDIRGRKCRMRTCMGLVHTMRAVQGTCGRCMYLGTKVAGGSRRWRRETGAGELEAGGGASLRVWRSRGCGRHGTRAVRAARRAHACTAADKAIPA